MQRHRDSLKTYRHPFWLPAANYYLLAGAAMMGVFSLVWGILYDGGVKTPTPTAAAAAGIVIIAAVILREVILRNARNRYLATKRLEQSLKGLPRRTEPSHNPAKLSLERNAAILREIAKKSEAARVLSKFSEGHREVFELCDEYIAAVHRELPTVGVGSPRIAALKKGNELANEYHHFHLLQWAEIESRAMTREANNNVKITERLSSANEALSVIEFALKYYPNDASLLDSERVLRQLQSSIKISGIVERAERAAFKGNYKRAQDLFEEALFLLRDDDPGGERDRAADAIMRKLERVLHQRGGAVVTARDPGDNE